MSHLSKQSKPKFLIVFEFSMTYVNFYNRKKFIFGNNKIKEPSNIYFYFKDFS